MYAGFYNPPPAAAVGAFRGGGYGALRRGMRWAALRDSLLETAKPSGMIYLILLGAEMLKIFMSRAGVPQATATWLGGSGLDPMTVMILLLVALILLGCLMDSLSMILPVIPFLWPVLVEINGGLYMTAEGAEIGRAHV